jgi:hypothetical protein
MEDHALEKRVSALEAELSRLREILQIDPETDESAIVLLNPRLQEECRAASRRRAANFIQYCRDNPTLGISERYPELAELMNQLKDRETGGPE